MELSFLEAITQTTMHEKLLEYGDKLLTWGMSSGIKVLIIVAVTWLLKAIAVRSIQRIVKAAGKIDKHGQALTDGDIKRMNTLIRIFSWTSNTFIVLIGAMMVLQEFGFNMGPIMGTAGIIGVAIGFGGQYLVKDLITGFFLIFENQYRIGDVIEVAGVGGFVEDISLRVTTMRDMNGTVHHIPHGEVKVVSNLSKKFAKVNLNVGVAYDADLNYVKEVVNRIGNELATDPAWAEFIDEAPQFLRVDSFEDSSIEIKITGITKPLKQWDVTGELRKRVKEGFEKAGISIPFPQRVVHHMNSESKPVNE